MDAPPRRSIDIVVSAPQCGNELQQGNALRGCQHVHARGPTPAHQRGQHTPHSTSATTGQGEGQLLVVDVDPLGHTVNQRGERNHRRHGTGRVVIWGGVLRVIVQHKREEK